MYGFDRKLFSLLSRIIFRYHEILLETEVAEQERAKARLRTWVEARPCSTHDTDNSEEWGMLCFWTIIPLPNYIF